MAPNPQCAALASAKEKSGLSYAQIAQKVGTSEARVIEICTAKERPTEAEFKSLAQALGISASVPLTGVHATI